MSIYSQCRTSSVVKHSTSPSTQMRLWLMVLQCRQLSWVATQAPRSRTCCWWMWLPCPLALRQLVVLWLKLWSETHVFHANRHRPSRHTLITRQQSQYRSAEHSRKVNINADYQIPSCLLQYITFSQLCYGYIPKHNQVSNRQVKLLNWLQLI